MHGLHNIRVAGYLGFQQILQLAYLTEVMLKRSIAEQTKGRCPVQGQLKVDLLHALKHRGLNCACGVLQNQPAAVAQLLFIAAGEINREH
ncbi:hypothetical protein D3C71_2040200 [compost metagenome]